MRKIVGIKFDGENQIFFYDAGTLRIYRNNPVITRYDGYISYGIVSNVIETNDNKKKLPSVVRLASFTDKKKHESNKRFENYVTETFRSTTKKYGLKLKLTNTRVTFDRTKIIFYFFSDKRVDFREFVRELARLFKTRIEMRQMGVRDEARNTPSIGICGRPLCCNKFLREFDNVSTQMAKDQGMSLNSVKISGNCGRLLCCLKYEEDMYLELIKNAPEISSIINTPNGQAKVLAVNILAQTAKVIFDDSSVKIYPFNVINAMGNKK